jgi:hypothetical protein
MEKTKDQHRGKGAMEHDQQNEGGNPSTQGQLGVLLPAGHLFPSWDHVFSARSDTSLQVSFDRYKRDDVLMEHRRTLAIEFKHHFAWSTRQDFVWGASYGPKRGTA